MSKFSVKKPLTVFVAVIAVLVLGVVAYFNMTPDLLPNMNFPYVVIMTTYPGASPETVEQELTRPMEQAMSKLEHIKEVSSTSSENYSMLMLEFEEEVNLDTIGVDIQQFLSALQAEWDDVVGTPYVLKINPSLLPVMVAAVSMDGKDNVALTEFLDEELMSKLEGVTGVARISTTGAIVQQIHVLLDQQKLDSVNKSLAETINSKIDESLAELTKTKTELEAVQAQLEAGLLTQAQVDAILEQSNAAKQAHAGQNSIAATIAQVTDSINTLEATRKDTLEKADLNKLVTMDMIKNILTAQNFSMPAGTTQQDGVSYMVSVGDTMTTVQEVEDLLLFDMGMDGVAPIYLKDVAGIMLTDNRGESYAKLDGLDSVMLSFEKQSTYATAETTENLNARFRDLEQAYPGLHFVPLMNQGDYIFMIVESILSSLLLGAIFAILILFLFLKDLRPTFITLCSIPISVIFAIVLMYFSGVTINMISLSGLAVSVGMLVDNSVVVIENIYRLRSKGANVIQAAVSGARQVAGAVTASTLTTVCVFLPIVFVQGITRQLFTDLALTMTYSLLASLIVSLTLVPAMASGMLRKEKQAKDTLMPKFLAGYEKAAAWALDHKVIVLTASAVLLAVTAVFSLAKGFIFMPKMDMSTLNVSIAMPEDATMEEASTLADEVLTHIDSLDGIKTAGAMMSSSGMNILGGGGSGGSYDVTVYVTLEDENASGAAVGKQIEALCADMDCTVTTNSAMMDMSMLSGSGISLEIYCDNMESLQSAAKTAADVLREMEGIAEVSDGLEDAAPALHISVDRDKAMSKGITVAQIYAELSAALQTNTTATTLELDGTSTEVIVEKQEEVVPTREDLENYPITLTSQNGETKEFLLSDVATVTETVSLNTISRLSQRRHVTVTAQLAAGENVTLLTSRAQQLMKDAKLGDGVTYAFTGENETIMEAVEQLGLMLLLGVLLVYLVMVAQFQSLKSPFIVMFTIPLAFTGGFVALLLCGMEVSIVALIGFIMLTGIIVNNGIVLVDYINQLRLEGMERREAILEAGKTRMRPILMTTITTVLGLIDMAVRKTAGTTLMQPVAVVCIGGLVYATIMTLFVVPCIYDMMNKKALRQVRDEDLKMLDL